MNGKDIIGAFSQQKIFLHSLLPIVIQVVVSCRTIRDDNIVSGVHQHPSRLVRPIIKRDGNGDSDGITDWCLPRTTRKVRWRRVAERTHRDLDPVNLITDTAVHSRKTRECTIVSPRGNTDQQILRWRTSWNDQGTSRITIARISSFFLCTKHVFGNGLLVAKSQVFFIAVRICRFFAHFIGDVGQGSFLKDTWQHNITLGGNNDGTEPNHQ